MPHFHLTYFAPIRTYPSQGMMETIRIRKQGYASRQPHKEFFQRYLPLAPKCATLRQLVDELSKVLSVSSEAWQVGTTKIFLKSRMSDQLDRLLLLRCSVSSRRIQKAWRFVRRYRAARNIQKSLRRFVAKRLFQRTMRVTIQLQSFWRRQRAMNLLRKAVVSVMKIQSVVRGKAARLTARRLRNPYNRMTYEELTQLLVTVRPFHPTLSYLPPFYPSPPSPPPPSITSTLPFCFVNLINFFSSIVLDIGSGHDLNMFVLMVVFCCWFLCRVFCCWYIYWCICRRRKQIWRMPVFSKISRLVMLSNAPCEISKQQETNSPCLIWSVGKSSRKSTSSDLS